MLRQLAARAGFEPRISFTADDLLAKTGMVAAGLGVALVPDLMLPSLRPDLAILRLKRAGAARHLPARPEGPRSASSSTRCSASTNEHLFTASA